MRKIILQASVLAVLTAGLIVTPTAVASAPPAGTAKSNSGKNTTPATTGANTEVLTALHQAKTLLDTAIHDYDGHRGKAVGEIHHAIHELTPHGHKGTKANAVATTEKVAEKQAPKTTTPGENQAQSDMQLKQALQILSELNGKIPSTHTKAAGHLQTAVEELNVALKIK
jgi:hypothetical protein